MRTFIGKLNDTGQLIEGHTGKPGQLVCTDNGPIGVIKKDLTLRSNDEHLDNLNYCKTGDKCFIFTGIT
jgi:hypothetical protein